MANWPIGKVVTRPVTIPNLAVRFIVSEIIAINNIIVSLSQSFKKYLFMYYFYKQIKPRVHLLVISLSCDPDNVTTQVNSL